MINGFSSAPLMSSFTKRQASQKMKSHLRLASCAAVLFLAVIGCKFAQPSPPSPSVFDSGRTAYGFFPTSPDVNFLSVLSTFHAIGEHGDVVLIQPPVPWDDFRNGIDGKSKGLDDIHNQVNLAWYNGLDAIFVVDPLNGLNRREFAGLPPDLAGADFSNPVVRAAFQNFALRIAKDFHPRYLGLASEINTYADAFPHDFPNFLSLYRETYQKIKAESPDTQVFVTFQWEDINNYDVTGAGRGATTKWEEIEAFEPDLDLWAISSYPFVAFSSAADIPDDYYSPLLERTKKPLAVAEGGFGSVYMPPAHGTPQDQVLYLNSIHDQIGKRLAFWIYLVLDDFNMDSYQSALQSQGQGDKVNTLSFFSVLGLRTRNGTPKPALAVWDSFRR
jgi:hypothetical protein